MCIKPCQAIIFWDNCHNKFQKKCPHVKENCVIKIESITKTWRAQNVNTLYGRLDWYFRFLTPLNSYGHNSIKFDMFKIYKRYQRVVPFIAFFIRADKNGL